MMAVRDGHSCGFQVERLLSANWEGLCLEKSPAGSETKKQPVFLEAYRHFVCKTGVVTA